MAALIRVLDGGLATSLQDAGRFGFRNIGMTTSGALDLELLQCANALVGNPPYTAALELRSLGPQLQVVSGVVRLSLVGDLDASVQVRNGRSKAVVPLQSFCLKPHEVLRIGEVRKGVAYLSLEGGFQVEPVMGSCSTYSRAAIGGFSGRTLRAGDELPCVRETATQSEERRQLQPFSHAQGEAQGPMKVRVVLGPQEDYFTAQAMRTFVESPYTVSLDADRMGIRLEGVPLQHGAGSNSTSKFEIISDGITPGAMQVPANGLPILLLADCQTVGGYPKIATVITADLPLLGHLVPGDTVIFHIVSLDEAYEALIGRQQHLQQWIRDIQPVSTKGVIDEEALYESNIVGGMVDACE